MANVQSSIAPLGQATTGLLNQGKTFNSVTTGASTGLLSQYQGNGVSNAAAGGLLNQSYSTPINAANSQGLLNQFSQGPTQQVTDAQNQYNQFAKTSPFTLSDVANNPNVAAEVSVGRGQALGQTLSGEQQALAQGVTNAQTQQAAQIGAAENMGTQALTGQQQQIGAGTAAGNIGNTAQSNQITAQNAAGNLGLGQQSNQTTALNNAASQSQPVTGPGGVLGSPQSVGGFTASGAGSNTGVGGGITSGNVASASALTQDINGIQSDQSGIGANLQLLNSYAKGIPNINNNSSLLTQLTTAYANTVQGSSIVSAYQQAVSSLTTQAAKYGIAMPSDPTPAQIQGVQQSLTAAIQNQLKSKQDQLDKMSNSASSTTSNSSSNNSGGITEGTTGAGGALVYKGGKWVVAK